MSKRLLRAATIILVGLGPLLIASLFVAQVQGPQVPIRAQIPGPFPDRGERCPGHGGDEIPPLVLSGQQTNVPEFNDCQRFIINGKYGPLYAVFAAYKIKDLLERLKQLECQQALQVIRVPGAKLREPTDQVAPASGLVTGQSPGQPAGTGGVAGGGMAGAVLGAATVLNTGAVPRVAPASLQGPALTSVSLAEPSLVFPTDCRANKDTPYNGVGVPFAEVVSWGGTYGPLGIEPNFNCLYLYDSAALKAVMVPLGLDEPKCGELVDPVTVNGTRLHVRVTRRQGLTAGDYPGVARWDVRPANGVMYVGMACGPDMWCEVGRKPPAIMIPANAYSQQYQVESDNPKARRVLEVKGWYDEQVLAVLDDAGKPTPSGVRATVIPHPDLDSYTDGSFTAGTWLPAATIIIRGQIPKYKHSLNLDASFAPPVAKVNSGFLCRGLLKECIPDPNQRTHLKSSCLAPDRVYWYAKVVSVKGQVMHRCVSYYNHPIDVHIPGTVRWAWFDTDEGGWWRCPTGCCYPD